jgi:hypothetical protein
MFMTSDVMETKQYAQPADLAMVGPQVEQAACRREAAAAARQKLESDPAKHGASHTINAHAAARADGVWYADENDRTEPESCSRADTLNHRQWQRGCPIKASGEEARRTNGTTAPAADSRQRQQRLQQLYQELQLLDGDALQPRSCSPCR